MRDPSLEPPSLHRQMIILAQADQEDKEKSYRQDLDFLLEQDDFATAEEFVDDLSRNTEVSPATLRSLKSQIRSMRTARLVEYAQKIREAIASSDMETVAEYSQRMQRLKTAGPNRTLSPDNEAETYRPGGTSLPTQEAQDTRVVNETRNDELSPAAEETIPIQRIEKAINEDRLLPPANDNAFALAETRLTEQPDDAQALRLLDDVINKQQSKIMASLDAGRPETALELTRSLIKAVERLDDDTEPLSGHRSSALSFADEIKLDVITGLIANAEKAMEQWNLTVAPEGKPSAEGIVGLLATELGEDHGDVLRLANDIVDRYQGLISGRLSKRQYEDALTFHDRMQAVAERFSLPTDQMAEQRRFIAELPARQQQHDQLLQQAAQWRSKGQLIEPAGANALEFVKRAILLKIDPIAAGEVYNDVIFEQRKRIDSLIEADRLEEAVRQLRQLGAAVKQVGASRSERADLYFAEADRISEQAERKKEQQRAEAAERAKATAPADDSNDPPFTFVNPF